MEKYTYIHIMRLKDIAHVIMEADKSQDVQSISKLETQESWKQSSHLKVCRLEMQEEQMFQFESKDRKSRCPSLNVVGQEECSLTQGRVSPFVLFRPSADSPLTLGRAICFTCLQIQMLL